VTIQYGMEATGIDIRYRGDKGYVVSGRIAGSALAGPQEVSPSVQLMRTATNTLEAQVTAVPRDDEHSFAFYGVADGDYYIFARRGSYEADDGAASKRVPVSVRGRDVTGIAISLAPLGSLAGRVILDPGTRNLRCESKRAPAIEETLLSFSTDGSADTDSSSQLATALLPPDDKGDFIFRGLPAARYRLDIRRFLDPACYVRALTVSGPAGAAVDASRNGFNLRPGQRISGISVVIGEGAASLQGRVVPDKKGASLPERLRVHLIPAERESAGEMLRYFESEVQSDGHFSLLNLAPGRYWIVARPVLDNGPMQRANRPLAWSAATRAALRRDAQALNSSIELRPCQRVADYEVRYAAVLDSPSAK
jgi:hypothetical protein